MSVAEVDQVQLPVAGTSRARWGALLLVALTAVWGSTFPVLKGTIDDSFPPSVLMLLRFSIASLLLLPFVRGGKALWLAGMELALWLWVGYATQVVGMKYVSPNRSAFVTSLSVIFVPMLAAIEGRRIRAMIWLAAFIALFGAGLLSYDASRPNIGDLWTLACAISYAVFIYRLEWAAARFPPLTITALSVIGVAALSAIWVGIERPEVSHVPWIAVAYLGVFATAITTALQSFGQRMVPSPQVGVIYTMEPVFAAMFSFLLRGDVLGVRGWIGASLIVCAAILCQVPPSKSRI